MSKECKSEALAAAHRAARGRVEAGLMSKQTIRKLDETCLTPVRDMIPGGYSGRPSAGAWESSGHSGSSQRDGGSCEPVGLRREVLARRLAESVESRGKKRCRSGCRTGVRMNEA